MSNTSSGIEETSRDRRRRLTGVRVHCAVAAVCLAFTAACTSETPEGLIAAARRHIAAHDYRTAQIELRNAIELAPSNGTAYRLLGSALLSGGDPLTAEGALRKALSLAERPDDVVPALALALIRQGQPDRLTGEFGTRKLQDPAADASFQTSLGQAWLMGADIKRAGDAFAAALLDVQGYPPARLGQARITAQGGNVDAASIIADEVLAADPRLVEAHTFKAQLLLSQGRRKEAGDSLERALAVDAGSLPARIALSALRIDERAYDKAQALLDPAGIRLPSDPRLIYLRALLALRQDDFQKARDEVTKILGQAPEHVPTLILAGEIELRSNHPNVAEAHLQKALYVEPTADTARKLLAATYLRQGRPMKALDVLQPLLTQTEHKDAHLTMLAGEAYLATGDSARASEFFESSTSDAASESAARLKLGQIALARGDFDRGVGELQAASALDTAHHQADLLLFSLHLRRREFDKALVVADGVIKKQPRDPLGYVLSGTAHLAGKDLAGARLSFDAALKIQPDQAGALRGLADVDTAEGHPGDGLVRYEALLARTPDDERLLVALADLQERTGKVTEAGATLRRAITANPRSLTPYVALVQYDLRRRQTAAAVGVAEEGVAANPAAPRFVELLGSTQAAAGAGNDAVRTFQNLVRLEPQALPPLLKLAAAQARLRDFGAVVRTLRQAQQMAPDHEGIASQLVVAYLSAAKFDEALGVATAMQDKKPGSAVGHVLEGDVNAARRKWPEAERAYRQALAAQPRSGAIAIKLSRLLSASGRKTESAAFAANWIAQNPADMPVRMYVADVALAAKDYKAAALQYEAALHQNPDDVPALNNLAWTLGELKDPRAMGLAERAAALSPNSPPVLDTLGMLQLDRGDVEKAIASLARVRELAPDRKDLRLHYAMGLLRAGRRNEGKAELQELLASQEEFPGKATIPALLATL